MLKIGHRGAKGHLPENTIESFLKAFELGATGVELDVQKSLDNQPVVMHDQTVDRTIKNTSGFVKDFTVAECKKLGIPSLTDVFHILPETAFVNIEIKDPGVVRMVIAEIDKWVCLGELQRQNVVISSFDWEVLRQITVLNPQIQLGVLTEDSIEAAFAFATQIKAFSINPYFKLLTKEWVNKMQRSQFKIHTWTVNSIQDITFVKNLGVDAIISDFPDRL